MHDPETPRDPVEELAEEFLERYRQGERPPLTEFTKRRPDLASAILRLFPTLAMMEEMSPRTATPPSGLPADSGALESFGDYRIVRELGRGGMGVVYEAEHLRLGRQVALKILPAPSAKDDTRLKRFWREARAVARLHHTNIVPVFEVGEHQGVHFYAMQLIHGKALDARLSELRRRGQTPLDSEALQIAAQTITILASAAPVGTPGARSSGTALPAHSGHYREVARLGLQVAEALAYAHDHKILHRDIKPANLLVDEDGTAWVTDFGLAKEEGETLTRTGDVVGTLRYMAPERFNGLADGRSDVYSLGLTLYEYVTLQPAFDESDRGRLIQRIAREEPPRPRELDPHLPRDLETIILKASAKEPERRYRTAAEMAEDLRRFLADRPIRARRASVLEQAWRWSRRNRVVASLMAFSAALLALVAVITTVAAFRLNHAQKETLTQLHQTQDAQRDGKRQLYHALLAQAQASRLSGRPGQRFQTLAALREANTLAAELDLPADARLERRNAVISALVVPDLRIARQLEGNVPPKGGMVSFDTRLEYYARSDEQGNISVRRVADDYQIVRLPGPGYGAPKLRFSPDGRFLAAKYYRGFADEAVEYRVWDWRHARQIVYQESDAFEPAFDFTPDSSRVLLGGRHRGFLSLYEVSSGKEIRRLYLDCQPWHITFDPTGKRLAVCSFDIKEVRIFDTTDWRLCLPPFRGTAGFTQAVWRSDGQVLAAASTDNRIYVWDVRTGRRQSILTGHTGLIQEIAFNHRGDLLVSSAWDPTMRLWDPTTGRQLLSTPGAGAFRFSLDDTKLAQLRFAQPGLWQVACGGACRCLYGHEPDSDAGPWCVDYSPDGRLLASGSHDGLRLWDPHTGQPAGYLPVGAVYSVLFQADGACLLTSGTAGLLRWPLQVRLDGGMRRIRIGPPQFLQGGQLEHLGWDRKGARAAVVRQPPREVWFVNLLKPTESRRVWAHPEQSIISDCVMSANGKWVATGNWKGRDVRILDPTDGKELRRLAIPTNTGVTFSPDSQTLLTAAGNEYQFWAVDSWEPGRVIRTKNMDGVGGSAAFTPDGRTIAIVHSAYQNVRLFDTKTHRELATLAAPDGQQIGALCWSPDGSQLATTTSGQTIHLWDVRGIRRELATLNLDWNPSLGASAEPTLAQPIKIETDLGDPTSQHRLVQALDPKSCVRLCSELITLNPRDGRTYLYRARAYAELGQVEEAEQDYQKSRALLAATDPVFREPEQALFANYMAWHLVIRPPNHRDPARALPWAQQAVALAPNQAIYWNTVGLVFYRLGRYSEAVTAIKRSLGDGKRKHAGYDLLFLAMCDHHLGQAKEARTRYGEAIRWLDSHQKNLGPEWIAELNAFQAEAAALLHVPDTAGATGTSHP